MVAPCGRFAARRKFFYFKALPCKLRKIIEMPAKVCYNFNMAVRVKAYAKLNLTLSVTGKEGGYHLIDSLVCSVDLYDLIVLSKRKDGLVNVQMHGMGSELLPYEENNAVKAAKMYINTFGVNGADIKIFKNIPFGAGLGGSSADAAGVLRGMAELYGAGSEKQLKELCDLSGSDTGYMLTGGFARLSGRGEKVSPVRSNARLNFLLLVPDGGVSTVECYRRYDSCGGLPLSSGAAETALMAGDLKSLGKNLFNALYKPAVSLNPQIETAYKQLMDFSPAGAGMTGSGSGVFALFETPEFVDWAKSRYRGNFASYKLKSV